MASPSQNAQQIRRAQKESALTRELAKLFLQLTIDEPRFQPLSLHRVRLSADGGFCTVYFYASNGQEQFKQLMPLLIVYKPSLRKALSRSIQARHTPDLQFQYDTEFEKQRQVEDLMDKLKRDGQL